eukprot:4608016-Lingulodinium_polyedra.AAC.1
MRPTIGCRDGAGGVDCHGPVGSVRSRTFRCARRLDAGMIPGTLIATARSVSWVRELSDTHDDWMPG